MDLGDRQHRRVLRAHVARHDGLQRGGDIGRDDHRVDAGFGPRAMRALALDADVPGSTAGHHRAGADGELARLQARPVVHAEDGIAGELVEQPVGQHGVGATQPFLGRLEDEMHRAVEILRRGEIARRPQQHGGVAVMAAAMHLAVELGGVRQAVGLLHRQAVHVGAQPDGFMRVADAQRTDHAGLADAARHLAAPALQLLGDDVAGALLLETQLGMHVDVAADRGQFVVIGGNLVENAHRPALSVWKSGGSG